MRCFVQKAMRLQALAELHRLPIQLLQFKFSTKPAAAAGTLKVDKKKKTQVVPADKTASTKAHTTHKPAAADTSSSESSSGSSSSSDNQKKTKKTPQQEFVLDRLNLTPHQFWLSQGKGMERPYTGNKWFEKDVGYYHCAVCSTQLFTWDHKFQDKTGMASFWHHEKHAIKVHDKTDDVELSPNNVNVNLLESQQHSAAEKCQQVSCRNCGSHLGLAFKDGPPPTFKRYSINSESLNFVKKEYFENPHFVHKKRKQAKLTPQQEQLRKRSVLNVQQLAEKQQQGEAGKQEIAADAAVVAKQ